MVTPTCSRCQRTIPSDDVNVGRDVAYCRACNLSHQLSTLTCGAGFDANLDLSRPPQGVWQRNEGGGRLIGASHRSLGSAFGLLLIALFWNGITSVFVMLAISATLTNLGVTIPHWFPAPVMNKQAMGVGMTLFLWLFLSPFIAIGLAMLGAFLSCLAGRTEVLVKSNEGVIFTGIGPLGYRRRFVRSDVREVRVDDQQTVDRHGHENSKKTIVIETRAGKPLKFGSQIPEERLYFLAAAVQRAL